MGMLPTRLFPLGAGRGVYDAEVEFLESTGTQLVDIGINAKSGLTIKAKFGRHPSTGRVFGARKEYHDSAVSMWTSPSVVRIDYANAESSKAIAADILEVSIANNAAWVNGTKYSFSPATFDSGHHICLFGINNGGDLKRVAGVRVYYFKLLDSSGTLVRDFIPVRVGDKGALYDRVTKRLFGNVGTGSFVVGPDYTRGLVAWWDGLWNAGKGQHDSAATIWRDLSGSGRDGTLYTSASGWDDNALRTRATPHNNHAAVTFPNPFSFADLGTLEMVLQIDAVQNAIGDVIVFHSRVGAADRNAVSFVSGGSGGSRLIITTPGHKFHVWQGQNGNGPDIVKLGVPHCISIVYGADVAGDATSSGWRVFIDGKEQPFVESVEGDLTTVENSGSLFGRNTETPDTADGKLYACRIYDRALTEEEILRNQATYKERFGLP